jgi:hypothetical protein
MTRRQFVRTALGIASVPNCIALRAAALSFHCTPAPTFPVPLTEGVWHSQEFPVGKHGYNIWLQVDRQMPLGDLDCDLGPALPGNQCGAPPLLDLEWKVWDGATLVKSWPAKPIRASAWGDSSTSCFLGGFVGRKNAYFTLEWNVRKDAGRLSDLHPRVEIVKNPGYWCWL